MKAWKVWIGGWGFVILVWIIMSFFYPIETSIPLMWFIPFVGFGFFIVIFVPILFQIYYTKRYLRRRGYPEETIERVIEREFYGGKHKEELK